MSDKIKFWKTAKPFFTNKGINHDRICWLNKMRPFQMMMEYLKN